MKANDTVLTPDEEGVYTVTVNGETEINVEGVVDGIAPTFTGITPDATYYTTQKVTVNDTNLDSVTVNGKKVEGTSFTLAGNTDMTYTIAAKDKAGNSASITVYMKNISSLTPSDAITTANKQQLEEKKDSLTELLNNENLTNQEKEQLQAVLDKVNAALESIEKITSMQEAIDKLPAGVEPDDLAAIEQIEAIAEQYDQLSDNEKQQLGTSIDKLNQLLADSKNYQILEGMDSVWYIGSNQDLTITANGAPERLNSLLLDGKTLAAEAYTVQKGSTIVTLKADYLEKLAAGEHTLTFVYANGETKANFTIVAPAQQENENPTDNLQTGTANTILPWAAFAVVCAGAVIALIIYRKKNLH